MKMGAISSLAVRASEEWAGTMTPNEKEAAATLLVGHHDSLTRDPLPRVGVGRVDSVPSKDKEWDWDDYVN